MLTTKTTIVEETIVVKKEVKTYVLELNENQLTELAALLGCCCSDAETPIFNSLRDITEEKPETAALFEKLYTGFAEKINRVRLQYL